MPGLAGIASAAALELLSVATFKGIWETTASS